MHARSLVALALMALGCAPRVGSDCPPEARARAMTIVHRRDGLPAYAGQALMITSCGGGSFCHSRGASDRFGAPFDLDLVPQLADQDSEPMFAFERLRAVDSRIFALREDIYASVYLNEMPPGEAGRMTQLPPYVTFDDMGVPTPIPGLETPIGRETLRNWLACGAPVIERTGGLGSDTLCSEDGDCALTGLCSLDTRTCLPVGQVAPYLLVPITPTWSSIYEVVVGPRCTQSACHGGAHPAAHLDLSERDHARTALLSAMADPDFGCAGEGPMIVMNDPDHSLFYRKLNDPTICGGQMPRGGGTLAARYVTAIHDWIMAGAPP